MIFKALSLILRIKKPTKIPKELAIISIYSKFLKPEVYCNASISTPNKISPIKSEAFVKVKLALNISKDNNK